MKKRMSIICVLLLFIVGLAIPAKSQCKRAQADDVPHGANVFILQTEHVFGRIFGTVFVYNHLVKSGQEPEKDVVVEIYRYRGRTDTDNTYQEIQQVLENQKRIAACLTKADGKFSFMNLNPGNYLLLVGTNDSDGFNITHILVTLKPVKGRNKAKGLEIVLEPGI